jgi:hypothetical protein
VRESLLRTLKFALRALEFARTAGKDSLAAHPEVFTF